MIELDSIATLAGSLSFGTAGWVVAWLLWHRLIDREKRIEDLTELVINSQNTNQQSFESTMSNVLNMLERIRSGS